MQIGFRITVWAGPRTETKVSAYSLAVNEKTIKFANGRTVTSSQLEKYIADGLQDALEKVKNKPGKGKLSGRGKEAK